MRSIEMKRCFLALCAVLYFTFAANAEDTDGYSAVLNATSRSQPESGYVEFPDFPRMHIVEENKGTPDPQYAPLIHEHDLKKKIEENHFSSLQVRDLFIQPKR